MKTEVEKAVIYFVHVRNILKYELQQMILERKFIQKLKSLILENKAQSKKNLMDLEPTLFIQYQNYQVISESS